MLILFDQGTPVGIRDFLEGHTVKTAYELGWSTLLNGESLSAAEKAGFQVLLTTDKNLPRQSAAGIGRCAPARIRLARMCGTALR